MAVKKNIVFVIFTLFLLIGLIQLNSFLSQFYSDGTQYKKENRVLKADLEREKLRKSIAENQLLDLQNNVAEILPIQKTKTSTLAEFKQKQMSEILRLPSSEGGVLLSKQIMDNGVIAFNEKNYGKAIDSFKELLEKFPSSDEVIRARFLLGESYYKLGHNDECLDVVYFMLNHYPEDEMTGYLLLRNAEILKSRRRTNESKEIYTKIISQFKSYPVLVAQSEKLKQEVDK